MHWGLVFTLLILRLLFLYLLLCLLNSDINQAQVKTITLLNEGAPDGTQCATVMDLNMEHLNRGQMTLECILLMFYALSCVFLISFLVVKCDFQIKMTFSSLKLFFFLDLYNKSLERSIF